MTRALARPIKDLDRRRFDPKSPVHVYLATLAPSGHPAQLSALHTMADVMRSGATAFDVQWEKVRYEHAQALRAWLAENYAPRTVNRMLSALRGVLAAAWNMELMPTDDYMRTVKVKSLPRSTQAPAGKRLQPEDVEKLLAEANPRDAAMIAMLYAAGMRRDEVASIELEDYDAKTGELDFRGKRSKARKAYLVGRWKKIVDDWIRIRGRAAGPILSQRNRGGFTGKPITPSGISDALEKLRVKCRGVPPFSPHDLRRSYGTHLLESGVDILLVMKLMGHSDVATTAIYDKRAEKQMRKAMEEVFGAGK